jgi:hypothetical protein
MFSLLLDAQSFGVPMGPLVTNCRLFQTEHVLLLKPDNLAS